MSYRVFLGPPSSSSRQNKCIRDFRWQTVSHYRTRSQIETTTRDIHDSTWICPPATLHIASQRITDLYESALFAGDPEEDGWSNLNQGGSQSVSLDSEFPLLHPPSTKEHLSQGRNNAPPHNGASTNIGISNDVGSLDSLSFAHTSTSSITSLPSFVIDMYKLVRLSSLAPSSEHVANLPRRINVLVAVLEVDGPSSVVLKKGPDSGKEVSFLKLMIGDNDGSLCKLTAWRETADIWGGSSMGDSDFSRIGGDGVQKGDIVYIENVQVSHSKISIPDADQCHSSTDTSLTASPNLASQIHICYRTLPLAPSDSRFRPDLRLAVSDPGFRNVAEVCKDSSIFSPQDW
ncbi:hypothetical protein PNOK_0604800 [Pyrrhoderma noxium]|uniref:Uncharacterized protein n=1 Tax=Pyrrhoderma noxium TaxID=2282107 RepID=A0A286UIA9_9AGAM|nr:hypothetical protein PNOK_0604800 [Pyrrhoderma noxium]